MEPWTANPDIGTPLLLSSVEARASGAHQFAAAIRKCPDLIKASNYPDTEMDIVTALIWRALKTYLMDCLFLRHVSQASENIECIRRTLENYVEPKRNRFD